MDRKTSPALALAVLAFCYIPVPNVGAQSAPPTDSVPAKKGGLFGRLRAKVLPGTTYAGKLLSPLLTEAQEKGVPGLHVQSAIHEFTGPSGDYPALAEGPANALAERLRVLIRDESGQQSRVADSIGRSATTAAAAAMAMAGPAAPSGVQLPADVAAALKTGRLALAGINWGAGEIAVRTALSSDLRGVAAEMNRLGAPWRIEVDATEAEGGKETARMRSVLVQNALVLAGLQTLNGGRAVLRPTKYGAAAMARVEVVRP